MDGRFSAPSRRPVRCVPWCIVGCPMSDAVAVEIISNPTADTLALVEAAVRGADDKLGIDPIVLDLAELLGVVEAFVIVSGRNERQVSAIVEEIEAQIKVATTRSPIRLEGHREPSWVLMDYGDVVIHVFLEETREFYDLEHLWSNAPRIDVSAFVSRPEAVDETTAH